MKYEYLFNVILSENADIRNIDFSKLTNGFHIFIKIKLYIVYYRIEGYYKIVY